MNESYPLLKLLLGNANGVSVSGNLDFKLQLQNCTPNVHRAAYKLVHYHVSK